MYVAQARPRIAAELADTDENQLVGLHRRFETVPGAQAQVDWGDEGGLLAHVGVAKVYSFPMVISDPVTAAVEVVPPRHPHPNTSPVGPPRRRLRRCSS